MKNIYFEINIFTVQSNRRDYSVKNIKNVTVVPRYSEPPYSEYSL
jgi:hypothetical protein